MGGIIKTEPAVIYRRRPPDLEKRIDRVMEAAASGATVFFRADDVAAPSENLRRLMELFGRHNAPLGLAVVPAWLTETRWRRVAAWADRYPGRWTWHQHGWRHVNHEPAGKKQEFGPTRSEDRIRRDLEAGRRRLVKVMAGNFDPIFTPPWNRIGPLALDLLPKLGYDGLSRSQGESNKAAGRLVEIPVNLDLHTRKDDNAAEGWLDLLSNLTRELANGWLGVMIHHQRMNLLAFDFLDLLLQALRRNRAIRMMGMDEILYQSGPETGMDRKGR